MGLEWGMDVTFYGEALTNMKSIEPSASIVGFLRVPGCSRGVGVPGEP